MVSSAPRPLRAVPVTAPAIAGSKGTGQPLVMITAYDAPSARAVDAVGADMILVGDSVAMVVLGYDEIGRAHV